MPMCLSYDTETYELTKAFGDGPFSAWHILNRTQQKHGLPLLERWRPCPCWMPHSCLLSPLDKYDLLAIVIDIGDGNKLSNFTASA